MKNQQNASVLHCDPFFFVLKLEDAVKHSCHATYVQKNVLVHKLNCWIMKAQFKVVIFSIFEVYLKTHACHLGQGHDGFFKISSETLLQDQLDLVFYR